MDTENRQKRLDLQPGDTILAVNEVPVSFGSLQEAIRSNAGKRNFLSWARGDQKMNARVIPIAEGRIGISNCQRISRTNHSAEQYSFFEALPIGIEELKTTSVLFLSNIYQIVIGKASLSKSMGGPVKIAQMAKRSADSGVLEFFGFIGLLSISLALLNILPFPALDGGHLVFLAMKRYFGGKCPQK